jgi:hypothetical protein
MKSRELEQDIEMLKQRFYIDPSSPSGLRMRIRNGAHNPKVIRKAGDVAGHVSYDNRQQSRWEVGIREVELKVSRIIWIILNGAIPDDMIVDHKDGNALNNSESNLQLLSRPQNVRALNSPYSCNTSGYLGVFKRPNNSWQAGMRRFGKLIYLGTFSNPVSAARKYNEAVIAWAEEHGETPRYLNPV